jgi:hypothetical protein
MRRRKHALDCPNHAKEQHHWNISEQLVNEGHRTLAPNGSFVVDINYLLKREQISLMRAERAHCVEARIAHQGLARGYGAILRQTAYPHADMPIIATRS